MAKFLILWEEDTTRIPEDPKERIRRDTMLLNMVKEDLESGRIKDWGVFPGEHAGFAICEGTEQDLLIGLGRYDPFIKFKTHSVISLSQVMESIKALSQA